MSLNRIALRGNILDRLTDHRRRIEYLERRVAMAQADPGSGEGAITYIEILNQLEEGPDIDLVDDGTHMHVARAGNVILLFDSGGAVLGEYAFTDAGLIAGLAAMAAGDVLKMYAGTISGGPWTLANGTLVGQSREDSILDGQITGSDATAIENLSIIRSEDDAGAISGLVEGAGEITMTLVNVTIDVSNATGEAHATHMSFGGEIKVYDTELLAETGSAGYAAYVLEGDFYQFGGRAKGTTAFLPYYV